MTERSRRRQVVIHLDQNLFDLLARDAAEAERIPEQHASYLVRCALLATGSDSSMSAPTDGRPMPEQVAAA
jgi:hypothetical protein